MLSIQIFLLIDAINIFNPKVSQKFSQTDVRNFTRLPLKRALDMRGTVKEVCVRDP